MKSYYAGIGSRKTPENICQLMIKIARYLHSKKYILRSGGADGADTAFENGASNEKEIYLPWKNFNQNQSSLYEPTCEAFEIASQLHPAWNNCKQGAQHLHARNVHQILGQDLKTPVDFVVCWTLNGKIIGGTATAINLAILKKIDVFNLANDKDLQRILKVLERDE